MKEDLKDLVEKAKKGDTMALSALYESNFISVYRYAFAKVGNKQDAEDIAGNTFLRMIDNIETFTWKEVPFKAWLIRIAHNLAMDHFRKKAHEKAIDDQSYIYEFEDQVADEIVLKQTLSSLNDLSEKHRSVLMLRFIAGLSCKETAVFMKMSEENIRITQHRALKQLRSRFES